MMFTEKKGERDYKALKGKKAERKKQGTET